MRGLFITVEGGDGAGKTTHTAALDAHLRARGESVLRTREPGGTAIGVELRRIVLHTDEYLDPRAEALLYAADRAQHIQTVVRPALERGEIVLQDRYFDSSIAYQGSGRDLSPERIRDLSLWAARGLLPDLTVLLDIDPSEAARRMQVDRKGLDRLESQGLDFHTRVRDRFLALADAEPDRFLVVDAGGPVEQVAARIRARVDALLDRRS